MARTDFDADDEGTAAGVPDDRGIGDLGLAGGWRHPGMRGARLDAGIVPIRMPASGALLVARQDPAPGVSPDAAVAAVRDVLDTIGDT